MGDLEGVATTCSGSYLFFFVSNSNRECTGSVLYLTGLFHQYGGTGVLPEKLKGFIGDTGGHWRSAIVHFGDGVQYFKGVGVFSKYTRSTRIEWIGISFHHLQKQFVSPQGPQENFP